MMFSHVIGLYEIDYRIFVSTRDAEIFSIKREMKSVQNPIITMTIDIIGMIRVGKQVSNEFQLAKHSVRIGLC